MIRGEIDQINNKTRPVIATISKANNILPMSLRAFPTLLSGLYQTCLFSI